MLKPLMDRMILKPVEEEVTKGGFVLPSSAKEKSNVAEVVAISDKIEDTELKVGDHVLYETYAATEVKHNGEDYLVVKEKDIMAVIRG
ncbi:co-chaperone GroES [Atopobacter sp. AH10]|uniref:co-chaperone GroES n=1 Tax=Atopobacter sp. AH10 TaxID=2315861 RepID=UPI000EF2576A|nr:co-chaperone GroES [Atopobacter sp. AH10]RLK63115.1 co-chaperone GroES [Atopobacter sp. AH10]